ncbi:MAG: RNA-directed DNA polymerase, partial [Proteobacteria bacterium]|nr:RNA-directed DNA polymerase [Pseudomonadota bacterium]
MIILKLSELKTPQDLATYLGVDYFQHVVFHIYIYPKEKRYLSFEIPKKSGGTRKIQAPATHLKTLQRKLASKLIEEYRVQHPAHGFLRQRSIITNADRHINKRYVLNIDLKDFFGTINFGRVRGMFMGKPYSLPPKIATILAQICCHDNALPQGAPTSPIITNMICSKLDNQLRKMAQSHLCTYTRYADDITISTNRKLFPKD